MKKSLCYDTELANTHLALPSPTLSKVLNNNKDNKK